MTILEKELDTRKIPNVLQAGWNDEIRQNMLDIMQQCEYGYMPAKPIKVEGREYKHLADENCFDGKATYKKVQIVCQLHKKDYPWIIKKPELGNEFTFDINCYIPKIPIGKKIPAVIATNDREAFDFGTCPADYLCEQGIAVFNLRYRCLTNDPVNNNGLTQFDENGLDRFIFGKSMKDLQPGDREDDAPGSIAIWAWGLSRIMDYVETLDFIDFDKIAVAGHSRLGKTVLLAGAMDDRFTHVYPNASCGGGVALSSGNTVESLGFLANRYPKSNEWFCEHSKTYGNEVYIDKNGNPFDQHFLIACVAPRKLYVGNAKEDVYCDVNSEYLACVAADKVYKHLGLKGFVHPDRFPEEGDMFHEGDIGYHLRPGAHAFNLDDWEMFVRFFLQKEGV